MKTFLKAFLLLVVVEFCAYLEVHCQDTHFQVIQYMEVDTSLILATDIVINGKMTKPDNPLLFYVNETFRKDFAPGVTYTVDDIAYRKYLWKYIGIRSKVWHGEERKIKQKN